MSVSYLDNAMRRSPALRFGLAALGSACLADSAPSNPEKFSHYYHNLHPKLLGSDPSQRSNIVSEPSQQLNYEDMVEEARTIFSPFLEDFPPLPASEVPGEVEVTRDGFVLHRNPKTVLPLFKLSEKDGYKVKMLLKIRAPEPLGRQADQQKATVDTKFANKEQELMRGKYFIQMVCIEIVEPDSGAPREFHMKLTPHHEHMTVLDVKVKETATWVSELTFHDRRSGPVSVHEAKYWVTLEDIPSVLNDLDVTGNELEWKMTVLKGREIVHFVPATVLKEAFGIND